MCYGIGCEHENNLTGECGFCGPGYYPCNDWEDAPEEQPCPAEGEEE